MKGSFRKIIVRIFSCFTSF